MKSPRMRTRLAAVVLTAAVLAPLTAMAAAPEAQGWWWRAQSGVLVAVPAPPQVPPGGLYVEGAPDGPSAVSALRFRVPDGSAGTSLVLKVAREQGGEAAVLLACPAEGGWSAAVAGAWEQRPAAACNGQGVLGKRAEDGSAWTFAFTLSPLTGVRDLVLVPGVDDTRPEGVNGSVFSVAFAPPDQDALVTRTDVSSAPPSDPPPALPPPDFGGGPFVSAPPATGMPPRAGPPAPPEAPDPSVIQPRITPRAPVAGTTPVPASKDARALATLIALLSVGVAGVLSRDRAVVAPGMRRGRRPASAEDRLGGLGRFRRPRSEPPPPL